MSPEEMIIQLREKAKMYDYEGWVETATDYENAASMIELLFESNNNWKLLVEYWKSVYESLLERLESYDDFLKRMKND